MNFLTKDIVFITTFLVWLGLMDILLYRILRPIAEQTLNPYGFVLRILTTLAVMHFIALLVVLKKFAPIISDQTADIALTFYVLLSFYACFTIIMARKNRRTVLEDCDITNSLRLKKKA